MKEKVRKLLAEEDMVVVPLDYRTAKELKDRRVYRDYEDLFKVGLIDRVRAKLVPEGETEKAYRFRKITWKEVEGMVEESHDTIFLPKSKTIIGKKHLLVPYRIAEQDVVLVRTVFKAGEAGEEEVEAIARLLETGSLPEELKARVTDEELEEVGEDELFDVEEETKPEEPPPRDVLEFVKKYGEVVVSPLAWEFSYWSGLPGRIGGERRVAVLKGETRTGQAWKFERTNYRDGRYRGKDYVVLPKSRVLLGKDCMLVPEYLASRAKVLPSGYEILPRGYVFVKGKFSTISAYREVKALALKKLLNGEKPENLKVINYRDVNLKALNAEEVKKAEEEKERKRRRVPRPPSL